MNCLHLAQKHIQWSSKQRQHLHRHPELSLKEKDTAAYCQKVLSDLGYLITPSWKYGFTADLDIKGATKRIALRADMDALPIQEENTHNYVSSHQGIAHMCGHDTHMAIALTTAKLLIEHRDQLNANVRFLFQPSEELIPGGALGMIEKGCLDGVDEVYGLHNDPGTEVGYIRLRRGSITAAADQFSLVVTGRSCHAARPHDGLDPIVATAEIITQWQSIIPRHINPAHLSVITVGSIHGGNAFNVIPDDVEIAGTVRTYDNSDRDIIKDHMQATLSAYEQCGYRCQFEYTRGYDATTNTDKGYDRVVQAATKVIGSEHIDANTDPVGWGEDFAYFIQNHPGAFYFLGSGNQKKGITHPLHSSQFNVDEACLPIGAAIMLQIILDTDND